MKETELRKAISERRIPKDKLSNSWDLGIGMLPVTMIFFASVVILVTPNNPISTRTELILFSITGLLFATAVYYLLKDRKLKSISTSKSRNENRILIIETLRQIEWGYKEDPLGVFHVDVPFVFGHAGHLFIVIYLEGEILFNCRNVGTSKGRMPFLFGIDTFKELKFICDRKN
ncbi:hypothetical protein [Chryseolinea sp. H1M3-3]|uniref:hypothetical protein n=1 Tax=Chryseolinea sp. H1M3-3 TaxID=3034144 RepID=UPI0023EC1B71|nr:hypothetical protein [Chryseolinea sp. H1M3-3]